MEIYGVIYKITNLKNNKVYIGQTTTTFNRRYDQGGVGIERVYNFHNYRKIKGFSYNERLLNSIIKYGFDNFEIKEIIDIAFSQKELDLKEKYYIKHYKSNDKRFGFNIMEGGLGSKHAEETKLKIKESKINISDETRKKMSLAKLGKPGLKGEKNGMYGKTPWNKNKKFKQVEGGKNGRANKVICLNDLEVFECAKDAAKKYNLKAHTMIGVCCRGKQKSCGKKSDGEKLLWAFLKDYEEVSYMNINEIEEFKKRKYK